VNAFWAYFWPPFCAGLLISVVAGAIAFRRRRRRKAALAIGLVLSICVAALWHGPGGAADRFSAEVER
jgi:CHASE2 domain-containing sensor protein